jgi:hypothetical protein
MIENAIKEGMRFALNLMKLSDLIEINHMNP